MVVAMAPVATSTLMLGFGVPSAAQERTALRLKDGYDMLASKAASFWVHYLFAWSLVSFIIWHSLWATTFFTDSPLKESFRRNNKEPGTRKLAD